MRHALGRDLPDPVGFARVTATGFEIDVERWNEGDAGSQAETWESPMAALAADR